MDNNFFLFLLEEDELKGYFSQWPEKMLVAIAADADEGFSLILYREEEQDDILKKLSNKKSMELSDLYVIPKIEGHPTMNILFSQEQEIVNMVRNDPEVLEAAEDYTVNYQFAVDEGLSPDNLIPEVDEDAVEHTVEEDADVNKDITSVTSDDEERDESDTDEAEDLTEAEVDTTPAKPESAEMKTVDLEKIKSKTTKSWAKEEPKGVEQAKPEVDETDETEAPEVKEDDGFLTPEEASNVIQIDAFVRHKGHKIEVSPKAGRVRIKGPLQSVLIKDDLSSFVVKSEEAENTDKLMKTGFSVDLSDIPAPLKAKLDLSEEWQSIQVTTHKIGLLISPVAKAPKIEMPVLPEAVTIEAPKPSMLRRAVSSVAIIAASVMIALSPQFVDYRTLAGFEPPVLTQAEIDEAYYEELRKRVFAHMQN